MISANNNLEPVRPGNTTSSITLSPPISTNALTDSHNLAIQLSLLVQHPSNFAFFNKHNPTSPTLRCASINVGSLMSISRQETIVDVIQALNLDALAIQETWLSLKQGEPTASGPSPAAFAIQPVFDQTVDHSRHRNHQQGRAPCSGTGGRGALRPRTDVGAGTSR